jgi:hypothetical protein
MVYAATMTRGELACPTGRLDEPKAGSGSARFRKVLKHDGDVKGHLPLTKNAHLRACSLPNGQAEVSGGIV